MVQEMLVSDSSPTAMSPARISFSYDLICQSDVVQPISPPSIIATDFDFCVRKSCDQDSSSADELFSDGKILPAEIKKKRHKPTKPKSPNRSTISAVSDEMPKKQSSETISVVDETEEKQSGNGRSFWRFKRSSSLNCGSGYGPSLCPLPLLSRSYSTGSSGSSSKRTQKTASSGSYQKPPLKKSYGGQGNGVRVNPVLHVPVVNIFGIGSIFSSSSLGRDKNKIVKK